MRLILFFITGWILWRIIRVMMRMSGSSNRDADRGVDMDTPSSPGASKTRRTIQDAQFEDLTPPPPPNGTHQDTPRG